MARTVARARLRRACLSAALINRIVAVASLTSACGRSIFGKVYEYEEDIYLALDGSADVIVNASVAALVSLRGVSLSPEPAARLDRDQIRAIYDTAVTDVTRVSRPWWRQGRRFVQVRLHVPDVRALSQAGPFPWSTYALGEKDGVYVYRQVITASALRPGTLKNVGWKGGELVAIRLHLPSKIVWHNARDLQTNEPSDIARGNILAWEQQLTDRLDGRPLTIEVRLDRHSILYRTLWLFAGAFGAAVALIALLIWLTMRKGARAAWEFPGAQLLRLRRRCADRWSRTAARTRRQRAREHTVHLAADRADQRHVPLDRR